MADSAFDTGSGGAASDPEAELRRRRLLALNTGTGAPGAAPIAGDMTDPEARRQALLAQAMATASGEQKGLLSGGNPNTSDPLGVKGSTGVSKLLGSAPSTAAKVATGTAPQSLEAQQALGSAPLSSAGTAALGTNTGDPNTLTAGAITNLQPAATTTQNTQTGGAGDPAAALAQARTGAPAGYHWEKGADGTYRLQSDQPATTTPATTTPVTSSRVTTGTPNVNTDTTGTGPSRGDLLAQATSTPPAGYHMENGRLVQDTTTTTTTQPPTIPGGGGGAGGGAGGAGGAGSGTGNLATGQGGDLNALTSGLTQQLNDIQNQINSGNQPADVQILYKQQLAEIMASIDQEMNRLRQEAETSGTSLDPATEFTLQKMREELDRQLKQSDMAANARGLFNSGIREQGEIDLRKGNMSDQAYVLSTRLSKIKDDLTQSLRSLGQRKLDSTERLGEAGITAQLNENNRAQARGDTLQGQLLSARLDLSGQASQERQSANQIAATKEEGSLNRAQQLQLAQLEREYGDKQFNAKNAQEFEMNKIQFEQEKALIAERAKYDTSGSGAASTNVTRAVGTTTLGQNASDYLADLVDAENESPGAGISTREEAQQRIREMQTSARWTGLTPQDVAVLLEAAQKLPSGVVGAVPTTELERIRSGSAGGARS